MESNEVEEYKQGDLILNENEGINSGKIKIPKELFNKIIKVLKDDKKVVETKQTVEEMRKSGKKIYEVIMKPDVEEAIKCGDYVWDECALEIRNVQTGKYATKANLKISDEVNTREIKETITKEVKPSTLSNITKTICNISGQVQLAEISEKIELMNEKIDDIKASIWIDRVAKLQGCSSIIEKAIELLPNEDARIRINNSISDLDELSKVFLGEIEKVLTKRVSLSIKSSMVEGLTKILNIFKGEVDEYNDKYINEIRVILREYSFLLDCYCKSMTLLGTCYQIMHGYDEARCIYDDMNSKINIFSEKISKKIMYLLDVTPNDLEAKYRINDIANMISNRNVNLQCELLETYDYEKKVYTQYNTFNNQFKNTCIKLLISEDDICGEGDV